MEWILALALFINGERTGVTVTSFYETAKDCGSAHLLIVKMLPVILEEEGIAVTFAFDGECELKRIPPQGS